MDHPLGQSARRQGEIETLFGGGRGLNILARSVCGSEMDVKIGTPHLDVFLLQLFGGVTKEPYPGVRIMGDLDILLYDPSPDTLLLASRVWSLAPKWRYIDLAQIHPGEINSTLTSHESAMGDGLIVIDNFSFTRHLEYLRYWLHDIRFEGHKSFGNNIAHLVIFRGGMDYEIFAQENDISQEIHRVFDLVICEKREEQGMNPQIGSLVDMLTGGSKSDELLRKIDEFGVKDITRERISAQLIAEYITHARSRITPVFTKKEKEILIRECESMLLTLSGRLKESLIASVLKLTEAIARVNLHEKVKQEDIQLAVVLTSWHILNEQNRFSQEPYLREGYPQDQEGRDGEEQEDMEEERITWESFKPIQPVYTFNDIILSEKNRREIEELLCEIKYNDIIYERWQLKNTLKRRRGTKVLFVGYPGTGKTVTAEAIANALGRGIIIVNYAHLEDKYVGETEKNIVAAFEAARNTGAILMFDECDAVLYQRSVAERSFSNRDVSVLLREMEMFDGVLILTSNLSMLIDPATKRRLDAIIEFEFPDEKTRELLWKRKLSPSVPVAPDVDLRKLAVRYPLTGGQIENVIRSAIRQALMRAESPEKAIVSLSDFESAARKEMEKDQRLIKDYLVRSRNIRGYG